MTRRVTHPAVLLGLLATALLGAASEDPAKAFAEANAAYKSGDYEAALKLYRELDRERENPLLYLNLGNAAFKTGRLGYAILYYERGLRLSPRDPDLRDNLRFVSERTVDRADVAGSSAAGFLLGVYQAPSLRELLVSTSLFWWLTLCVIAGVHWLGIPFGSAFMALFHFLELPKSGRFAALLGPSLAMLLLVGGWTAARVNDVTTPRAVIVQDAVDATSGPGADHTVVFKIHEGTAVTVHRRSDRWVQISLPNGYSGWVPSAALEVV